MFIKEKEPTPKEKRKEYGYNENWCRFQVLERFYT